MSAALPMTGALSPLATRFGIDLTPFREREQAWTDKADALSRDLATWIAQFPNEGGRSLTATGK